MRQNKNKSKEIYESIQSRIKLLEQVLQKPQTYASETQIVKALSSQGGLASLTYSFTINATEHIIRPLSITTLKAKISTCGDGLTWETYNALRLQARDSILQATKAADIPKSQTKLGIKNALAHSEREHEIQREINFRLLQALSRTIGAIRDSLLITKSELRAKQAEETIESIYMILGLNEFPFNRIEHNATILTLIKDS